VRGTLEWPKLWETAHPYRRESKRLSKKGKPPGGDPAAPVRRRSCRGAGSATAGA